jgi:hypothetical protein
MLKRIHKRVCGIEEPWWRKGERPVEPARADDAIDAEAYRSGRKAYIKDGKGTPPAGAEE